jgi:steroid delta-isomerase-like uncharacterized protein
VRDWSKNSCVADDLRSLIERYNDAWNAHDLDAIHALHAPDIVFENFTVGERVEGADAVREHIATIFRNWPDLRFRERGLHAMDGFVTSEWTATASREGKRLEWDGVDLFPIENGLIKRKDVYSTSHRPREL